MKRANNFYADNGFNEPTVTQGVAFKSKKAKADRKRTHRAARQRKRQGF